MLRLQGTGLRIQGGGPPLLRLQGTGLNKQQWSSDFKEIEAYIFSLHHVAPPAVPVLDNGAVPAKKRKKVEEDTRVVVGPRKRGFIGFLINIQSYRFIKYGFYIDTSYI